MLEKLVNLIHTPPVVEKNKYDITPVPQPFVLAVSERWRLVWDVLKNAVRSAPLNYDPVARQARAYKRGLRR